MPIPKRERTQGYYRTETRGCRDQGKRSDPPVRAVWRGEEMFKETTEGEKGRNREPVKEEMDEQT